MGAENTSSGGYIALLEDDETLRKAMARLLATYSFRVKAFGSAVEFFNFIERESPFCLITDVNLPDMSGLAVLDGLRGETGLRIPTIVMTGNNDPHIRRRCEDAGVLAFFIKPVPGDALLDTIDSVKLRKAASAKSMRQAKAAELSFKVGS